MIKKINIELEDQINYDDGYGEKDCDVIISVDVYFEKNESDTEKGAQSLWQFKNAEIDYAELFFIDSDGGCYKQREWDDVSESDEKHYLELATKQAWDKL